VGQHGRRGAPTRLASGEEGRERLENILARSCACMARVSSFSFFSFEFLSNAKAGVVLGAMLVIWLGLGARS
jgi:hypothetical protein